VAIATAVIVYRLITYWAAMVPGWISLEVIKKRGDL